MPEPPALPSSFRREDLQAAGFVGWTTWPELRATDLGAVPAGPAAYVVYRPDEGAPAFLSSNPGGHFKAQDPTVPVATLSDNWVPGSQVVYIGKANDANRRLNQYARFGSGDNKVGHWGGRFIWQLADSAELLVAWHSVSWDETAREYEKRLLARFGELHDNARPFANLTG